MLTTVLMSSISVCPWLTEREAWLFQNTVDAKCSMKIHRSHHWYSTTSRFQKLVSTSLDSTWSSYLRLFRLSITSSKSSKISSTHVGYFRFLTSEKIFLKKPENDNLELINLYLKLYKLEAKGHFYRIYSKRSITAPKFAADDMRNNISVDVLPTHCMSKR